MRSNLPGDAKAKIDALLEQRHELLIQAEMRHLDDIATISEWGEGSTGQAA
jgi:hypothetical protein